MVEVNLITGVIGFGTLGAIFSGGLIWLLFKADKDATEGGFHT